MGFPFDKVTFVYFEDRADHSGHKRPTGTYTVSVLWNGSLTLKEKEQRYHGTDVVAEIKIMFAKNIPKPTPKILIVKKDGKNYKPVNTPDDLTAKLAFYRIGLEETKKDTP